MGIPDMLESQVTLLFVFRFLKHMLDQGVKEVTVGLLCPELDRLADVLQVMGMTQLDFGLGKVVEKSWF